VLRAFVVDGGLSIAFTPRLRGARHVGPSSGRYRPPRRACLRAGSRNVEEEALAQILDMFEAEIARPTDMGSTTPRSQQGH
jgi:hypothetical protein